MEGKLNTKNFILLLMLFNLFSCFGGSDIEDGKFDGKDVFVCVSAKSHQDVGKDKINYYTQCEELYGQKIENFSTFRNGVCADGEAHMNVKCDELNIYEEKQKFAKCDIGNKRTIYTAERALHPVLIPALFSFGFICEILGDFEL